MHCIAKKSPCEALTVAKSLTDSTLMRGKYAQCGSILGVNSRHQQGEMRIILAHSVYFYLSTCVHVGSKRTEATFSGFEIASAAVAYHSHHCKRLDWPDYWGNYACPVSCRHSANPI